MDKSPDYGARSLLPRFHPLVTQHPFEGQSEGDVRLQNLPNYILSQCGYHVSDTRSKHPIPRHLILEKLPWILIVKRHRSVEHDEEDDTERPHVRQFWIVRCAGDDFRRGVGRRAAIRLAEDSSALVINAESGKAEVRQFHVELPRE